MSMPPSDAGGGDGGSFFAGHQAATDNGSSSDSRLSFIVWAAVTRCENFRGEFAARESLN